MLGRGNLIECSESEVYEEGKGEDCFFCYRAGAEKEIIAPLDKSAGCFE